MQRKILFKILGAVLFVAASVHVGMSVRANNVDRDVLLANVEALSDTETVGYYGNVPITVTTFEQEGEIIIAFMFPMEKDDENGCRYCPGSSCDLLSSSSGGGISWDSLLSLALDIFRLLL